MWRPRWIVSHVLVLTLIVAMVNLGLWQLRRLDAKKTENARITANTGQAPLDLASFDARLRDGAVGKLQFTPVEVRGTYDTEHEVAVRNRTFDGAPGRWIATPLRPAGGGTAVLVVRGWAPLAVDDTRPPIDGVEPPAGEVVVRGWVQPTQTRGWLGPTDPATGRLGEVARVDLARIAEQTPGGLEPYWIQLDAQQPPTSGQITAVPLPALDEGPHFSYAVQWGIFTLIAAGGYPMVLRRAARQEAADQAADAAAGGDGGDGGGGGDGGDGDGDAEPVDPVGDPAAAGTVAGSV